MRALGPVLAALAVLCWPGPRPGAHTAEDGRGGGPRTGWRRCRGRPLRVDRRAREQRTSASVSQVADVAELLALCLRSGCAVVESMEQVGSLTGGLLGGHLRSVAAALRWGLAEEAAWAAVPGAWAPVSRALRLASAAGVAPADMLYAAADDIRRAERHRVEVAAARLGVRMALPLGLTFLPAFALTTVVPIVLALSRQVLSP